MMKRILIIDSEISFTIPLKRALEETGNYEVRAVTRLTPALNALQDAPYHVVVMDIELDQLTPQQAIQALRNVQIDLPVILTSVDARDELQMQPLQVQAFLQKRYQVRALIPILDEVIAQGYSSFTAETRVSQAILEAIEPTPYEIIEPLLEISRQNPMTLAIAAGITDTPIETTIGEVMDTALDPEVSRKIKLYVDPEPMPDEPTLLLTPQLDNSMALPENTPIVTVLTAADDAPVLDELINEIRTHLPDSDTPPVQPSFLSQLLATLPPPDSLPELSHIDPPPTQEDTMYTSIPRPPMLPDQDFLDQLPPETSPVEIPEDEPLMQSTVEEMTQQFMIVEEEAVEAAIDLSTQPIAVIPEAYVGHYALQLTQFSLESSAQGTLLTQGSQILAKAGYLSDESWQLIMQLIHEAWTRPGDARTRVIYRRLPMGEMLLYSILTIGNQTLTLLFSADTSLRMIRRQAIRLIEALNTIPEEPEAFVEAAEPKFYETESRLDPVEVMESHPEIEMSSEVEARIQAEIPVQEAVVAPAPTAPAPGTYTGYACFWLLEDETAPLSEAIINWMSEWLRDLCMSLNWEFEVANVQPDSLALRLQAPNGTLPNNIVTTLMERTADLIQRVEPDRAALPIWSDGYLIITPPDNLDQEAINRFIKFYRREKLKGTG